MALGLNRVTLIGCLGRAPEMRYTPTGKPVASFSIVTTHSWISSDYERHQEISWFNVVAWGNLAEACKQQLKVGQRVYVEGRMKTRHSQEVGSVPRSWAEVVAHSVIPLQAESQ